MEKFIVYDRARALYREICTMSSLLKGNASLRDQLKRASSSVVLNVAEARGRKTKTEKKRFFVIARGSAEECRAIVDLLEDEKIISLEKASGLGTKIHEIIKILTTLIYRW